MHSITGRVEIVVPRDLGQLGLVQLELAAVLLCPGLKFWLGPPSLASRGRDGGIGGTGMNHWNNLATF